MTTTTAIDSTGRDLLLERILRDGEVVMETIEVTKEVARDMKDIPRKFNETLTDWAIRCQVLRRYNAPPCPQAGVGDRTNKDHS